MLVGNCRGFVGNRMFHPYVREAVFLVEEGASVEAVDQALYDFGMAMGPLATNDLAGLDVGWRIRKEYRHLEKPGVRQPSPADNLCEMGRFGQKTGAGWYQVRREPPPHARSRGRGVDEEMAAEAGIAQRQISAEEIVDRCIYALVNEGARILEEGYAAARRRYRHHLHQRLRLPGLSRRPHVVRRHGRTEKGLRPHHASFSAPMANSGNRPRC